MNIYEKSLIFKHMYIIRKLILSFIYDEYCYIYMNILDYFIIIYRKQLIINEYFILYCDPLHSTSKGQMDRRRFNINCITPITGTFFLSSLKQPRRM